MIKSRHYLFCLFFIVIAVMISCGEAKDKDVNADMTQDIAEVKVNLPDAEGAELFRNHCITCHSLRYIEMQPDFPEKMWQKIVDKMVKSFGAPIPDSSSKAIVRYLMAIKGKEDK
jgi:cytochrome c5